MIKQKQEQEIIGVYQLGETLGKGAYGKVFKGLHMQTGETVAIKRIEKEMVNKAQLPSIMQELELTRKLYHPNIVRFFCHYESPEFLYFVLEFVEGGSLLKTMKNFGVFPESLIVIYMAQTLRGLDYLHVQGVIHRDIKSGNILLTKAGKIKLADFGSASYSALGDQQQTVSGTPFWMAPEVIEMKPPTQASDIWSVACTIIELLTGYPPYWEHGSMSAMFHVVEDDNPPLPDDISPDLQDFLKKCFIKDPSRRPSAKDLLSHQWITGNIKSEEQMQGPKPENVYNTIRLYNTIRTRKNADPPDSSNPSSSDGQAAPPKRTTGRSAGQPGAPAPSSQGDQEKLFRLFQENAKLVSAIRELKKQLDLAKKEKQIAESSSAETAALKKQIEEKCKKELKNKWKKAYEAKQKKDLEIWKKEKEEELRKDLEEKFKREERRKYKKSFESKQKKEMEEWKRETEEEIRKEIQDSLENTSTDLDCTYCHSSLTQPTPTDKSNSIDGIILGTFGFDHQTSLISTSGKSNTNFPEISQKVTNNDHQHNNNIENENENENNNNNNNNHHHHNHNNEVEEAPLGARKWHEKCFKCSYCDSLLKADNYLEYELKYYCMSHFVSLISTNCARCQKSVRKNFVRALGRDWHSDCFICHICHSPLKEYTEKDGRAWCRSCYRSHHK